MKKIQKLRSVVKRRERERVKKLFFGGVGRFHMWEEGGYFVFFKTGALATKKKL